MRTALYRHFDGAGALLYVGISLSAVQRLAQHRQTAHWFESLARVDVQWLETREEALLAEAHAITTENPRWNVARPGVPLGAIEEGPGDIAPVPLEWEGFQIVHAKSGRRDGNYFDELQAREMFDWWCAEYPCEQFSLCRAGGPARPELRSADFEQWRSAA